MIDVGMPVIIFGHVRGLRGLGLDALVAPRHGKNLTISDDRDMVPVADLAPFLRHRKGCARTLSHVGGPYIGQSDCDCGYDKVAELLGISVDTGYDGAADDGTAEGQG